MADAPGEGAPTVPFFGTGRAFAAHEEALLARIGAVLRGGRVLQGPEIPALEARLAELAGRHEAVCVNSCTDALAFALAAAGIGPGDDVLVPALSFVASAAAVVRVGARPVFVDVAPTGIMDPDDAAARTTPATAAMVAVGLYGRVVPPALPAFARARGLFLVADSAQSLGAGTPERPAGSLGDVACFSFDPTKTLAAPGSGGAAVCDDPALAERMRRLRYHGRDSQGRYVELGYNAQMPSATAAVLDFEVAYEPAWRSARSAVAMAYRRAWPAWLWTIMAPPEDPAEAHAYHKFVLRLPAEARPAVREALAARGVPTAIHYATPLPSEPVFAAYGGAAETWPQAAVLANTVLSLPIHAFLTQAEVDRIAAAVPEALTWAGVAWDGNV